AVSSEDFTLVASKSNEYIFREALVKWITTDNLLFTAVELESFQKLFEAIRKLEGDVTVPSARIVKQILTYTQVRFASLVVSIQYPSEDIIWHIENLMNEAQDKKIKINAFVSDSAEEYAAA
ncbi:15206_t:CDS:2, partial [Racocetra persica]